MGLGDGARPPFRWLMLATDPGDVMRARRTWPARAASSASTATVRTSCRGIDLRAALDTHTWGSMFVTVRNDGKAVSADPWVLAGDLVYASRTCAARTRPTRNTCRSASPSAARPT